MKKVTLLLSLLLLLPAASNRQVRFEQLSWMQALAKARKENKLLFIDVYTTWCIYCRQMDTVIFSLAEVGGFHNENFINVRYDALKADGIAIRKSYTLPGIPAFLYLDPQGMVIKKTAGYQTKEQFLQNSNTALLLLSKPPAGTIQ